MTRRRTIVGPRPIRNLARGAGSAAFSNAGQGRVANNRFNNNGTYQAVIGATDGPITSGGTQLTSYFQYSITTGRSRLGFYLADNPENGTPTSALGLVVKPGQKIRVTLSDVWASAAATVNLYARGSDGTTWSEAGAVSIGSVALAANTYGELTGVYTVPQGVTRLALAWWAPGTLATGVKLRMSSRIMITVGQTKVAYRSGTFAGWAWDGLPFDSESIGYITTLTTTVRAPWLPPSPLLAWAPPVLGAGYLTINVDDTAAKRHITIPDGVDARIVLPATPVTDVSTVGTYESMITVSGGRNVILPGGGRITAPQLPVAHIAGAAMAAGSTSVQVDSTAGFPAVGMLRIDGESISYTSKDATHFLGLGRNDGFYNDSDVSSSTTHAIGANVYISERHRSALSFVGQTGTVHVEGLLTDGFVCDALRFSGGSMIAQVQRCRLGPNTNYDLAYETDGHPDDIQAYGGGAKEIRLSQVSMMCGPNGNGLLNKGSDGTGGHAVEVWRVRDSEIVVPNGDARSLVANSDPSSVWDVQRFWLRYPNAMQLSGPIISSGGTVVQPLLRGASYQAGQPDIVPASSVGIGYVSPGYAA